MARSSRFRLVAVMQSPSVAAGQVPEIPKLHWDDSVGRLGRSSSGLGRLLGATVRLLCRPTLNADSSANVLFLYKYGVLRRAVVSKRREIKVFISLLVLMGRLGR